MKLMLIIISNEDTQDVTKGLLKEKFYVTKLATTGGLLHGGNTTLLLGVADEEVNRVKEIVSVYAKTRKKKVTTGEPGDLNLFSFFTRFPVWFVVESEIEKGGMRDAKIISEKRA